MKHLFIINPVAGKIRGRVKPLINDIEFFFQRYKHIEYEIHQTRWSRDATGYTHRYAAKSGELLRVHVLGGSGTLFEVVNGVVGLPNVQVAAYPMGRSNDFIRYFGNERLHLFSSIRSQVFSDVTAIDAIRCGNNYGISYGLVGMEATADKEGTEMLENSRLPVDLCYVWSAVGNILRNRRLGQKYKIVLDGKILDGDYITMMIANGPCYGEGMNPAVDAHPNDGILDIYMLKDMPKGKFIFSIQKYISGNYKQLGDSACHYRGSRISILSDSVMCMSLDGEAFYDNAIEYEIMPYAIDFVCPSGIDVGSLPKVYGNQEWRGNHGKKR